MIHAQTVRKVVDVPGDGNCLFRALSLQLNGNQEQHHDLRQRLANHIRTSVTGVDKEDLIARSLKKTPEQISRAIATPKSYNAEEFDGILPLLSDMLQRKIVVWHNQSPMQEIGDQYTKKVTLFCRSGDHYMSVVNVQPGSVPWLNSEYKDHLEKLQQQKEKSDARTKRKK